MVHFCFQTSWILTSDFQVHVQIEGRRFLVFLTYAFNKHWASTFLAFLKVNLLRVYPLNAVLVLMIYLGFFCLRRGYMVLYQWRVFHSNVFNLMISDDCYCVRERQKWFSFLLLYYVEQVRTENFEASLLYLRCFDLEQYSTFYQNT